MHPEHTTRAHRRAIARGTGAPTGPHPVGVTAGAPIRRTLVGWAATGDASDPPACRCRSGTPGVRGGRPAPLACADERPPVAGDRGGDPRGGTSGPLAPRCRRIAALPAPVAASGPAGRARSLGHP